MSLWPTAAVIYMKADEYCALGADVSHLSGVLRRHLNRLRAEAPEVAASAVAMMAEARALGRAYRVEDCRATLRRCEQLIQCVLKQESVSEATVAGASRPPDVTRRTVPERKLSAIVNEPLERDAAAAQPVRRPSTLSVTWADAWMSRR